MEVRKSKGRMDLGRRVGVGSGWGIGNKTRRSREGIGRRDYEKMKRKHMMMTTMPMRQ